ncbi:MAG: glycosyltransferase family 4 protein, partial [Gammaproteobacteria bacterium]
RAQFLDAFNLDANDKVVVCVAQLIPRKGHADLLAAWAEVIRQYPQARLVLFGRGKEAEALKSLASILAINDSVRFASYREDLRHFLGCADLLVHPALKEGLGICLLEAQAAGLPVVATRVGGIPEAVSEEETGLLVEPGKPEQLAEALLRLLQDEPERAHMAAAATPFVRQNFAPAAMISGNLAVYEQILGSVDER